MRWPDYQEQSHLRKWYLDASENLGFQPILDIRFLREVWNSESALVKSAMVESVVELAPVVDLRWLQKICSQSGHLVQVFCQRRYMSDRLYCIDGSAASARHI